MLHVTAPSWRSTGDITLPDDILEEVARLMGYENFDFIPPKVVLEKPINQRKVEMERSVREYLAFRCGMQEIFTYPWIEDEYIEASLRTPAACSASAHLRLPMRAGSAPRSSRA